MLFLPHFCIKNVQKMEKEDFNQGFEQAAPKGRSKYSTFDHPNAGKNIQHVIFQM